MEYIKFLYKSFIGEIDVNTAYKCSMMGILNFSIFKFFTKNIKSIIGYFRLFSGDWIHLRDT